MDQEKAIDYIGITKTWVEKMVIGLNLCPFAKTPFRKGRIRFRLFEGKDAKDLMQFFLEELDYLARIPEEKTETTLIVHPYVLTAFDEYLDAISLFEALIRSSGLEGVLQVASFHPDYQFAGTEKEAAQNYTNRSPFPMLHLIREDSISRAVDSHPDIESVPIQNIKKLEEMGIEEIQKLLSIITENK
jgi:hypothetical protein